MMKILKTGCVLFLAVLLAGCVSPREEIRRIVVISDTHLFDADRLIVGKGSAFSRAEGSNDVMMLASAAILDELFARIDSLSPQVVLIPGDLSNNGERINHELMYARYLRPLEEKGVRVFVTPGNHDINNPDSRIFVGDRTESTPSVDAAEFGEIYKTCGFASSISRDTASLSYSSSLSDELALIALDVCHYEKGISKREWLGGSVKPATMKWLERQINLFKAHGQEVIVMMHHSAFPHWKGENGYMPGFVIDNSDEFCGLLLRKGVKFIFSGHFHAQDIARYGGESGKPLFDISCGSAVSTACPIRIVDFLPGGVMSVTYDDLADWDHVEEGVPFREYPDRFVYDWVRYYIADFGIPEELAESFVRIGGDAFIANYRGDERLTPEKRAFLQGVAAAYPDYGELVQGFLVEGLYTDTYPQDKVIRFDLRTGEILP